MDSIWPAGGMSEGLDTATVSPLVLATRYSTDGAVEISDRSNSRSSRSRTISMCSRPRKPQRETEAERAGGLGLVGEPGVVEAQLRQGGPQVGEVVAVGREQAREHHRLGLRVPLQGLRRRAAVLGDGLARAGLAHDP